MLSTLVLCLIFSLGIAFFAMFKPLFMDKQASYTQSADNSGKFDETISMLETITELESDYKMGKLSKDDYEALSLEYKHHYLEKKKENESQ
jgi:hypothetical protein